MLDGEGDVIEVSGEGKQIAPLQIRDVKMIQAEVTNWVATHSTGGEMDNEEFDSGCEPCVDRIAVSRADQLRGRSARAAL